MCDQLNKLIHDFKNGEKEKFIHIVEIMKPLIPSFLNKVLAELHNSMEKDLK